MIRSWVTPVASLADQQMARERVDVLEPDRRVVPDERLPLLVRGRVDGRDGDLVVLGAVVVQHQQPVLTAEDGVLDGVLHPVPPWCDDAELPGGVVGVEDGVLGGGAGAGRADQEAVAAGASHAGPEPLVRLVEDDDVVLHRGAEQVTPDLVGPPGVVGGRVEQRGAVTVPGAAAHGVRDLVGEQLAGAQVLDLEQVALVADDIGAEREQPAVRAHRDRAEREEVVPLRQLVGVEEHLLAGYVDVGVELGRGPVVGPLCRATAARAVLLVLVGAPVVPPLADPRGHGEVSLLGVGADLLEDLCAQSVEVRRAGGRPGVLRLEVGEGVGGVRVAQPLVLVDHGVAVVVPGRGDALGLGRGARGSRRRAGRRCCIGHGGEPTTTDDNAAPAAWFLHRVAAVLWSTGPFLWTPGALLWTTRRTRKIAGIPCLTRVVRRVTRA